jgi:hypothetical protein
VRGRIQADSVVDLGELLVGQPVDVAVNLTNQSSATYQANHFRWVSYLGETAGMTFLASPALAPNATGQITLSMTPRRLGPTVGTISWMRDDQVDATTEVRLWAVP